jgi:hypothetical protein
MAELWRIITIVGILSLLTAWGWVGYVTIPEYRSALYELTVCGLMVGLAFLTWLGCNYADRWDAWVKQRENGVK